MSKKQVSLENIMSIIPTCEFINLIGHEKSVNVAFTVGRDYQRTLTWKPKTEQDVSQNDYLTLKFKYDVLLNDLEGDYLWNDLGWEMYAKGLIELGKEYQKELNRLPERLEGWYV